MTAHFETQMEIFFLNLEFNFLEKDLKLTFFGMKKKMIF